MHLPLPFSLSPRSLALAAAFVLASSASQVMGQSVWNGGGSNALWSNGENWNSGTPPASPSELHFTGVTNLAPQNDLAGFNITRLEFLSGAGALSLTGNDVTLSGNIINNSASAQALALNMALTAGTHVLQNNGGNLSLTGSLSESSGAVSLTKNGSGTLILGGDNSFTGAVSVAAGVVRATSNTAFGTAAAGVSVSSGARVELQGATVTGEALSIAGDGGDGQGALKSVGGTTSTWAGNITISSATGNFGNRIGTNGASTLIISGDISGSGDLAIRTDGNNAGIIQFSGPTKTYTGATFLVIGELRLGSANALPTGTVLSIGNTSNTNFATLNLNGSSQEVAGLISLGTTMSMKITSATAATLTVNNSAAQAFNGSIEAAVSLVKNGMGLLALGGSTANTYTGSTTLSGGVLRLDAANKIGDTSIVTLTDSAVLRLNGNADTVGGLVSSSADTIVENEGTGSGTLTVQINNTVTGTNTSATVLQTYAGVLRDGDGTGTDGTLALTVAKTGTGSGTSVLELTNASSYSGLTTVAGANAAIRVSNGSALGAGGTTANGTVVGSGGRVELAGGVTVASEVITIAGNGGNPNSAGALRSTGTGTAVWAGKVVLGAATGDGSSPSTQAARVGADGATLEISGQISDEGLNRDFAIRNNTGKTVVSGTSNSYRNTYLVIGELELGAANALPAGTILTLGNTSNTGSQKFDLNGLAQTVRGITDLGTANLTNLISNDASATNAVLTLSTQAGDDHQYGLIAANTATIGGNVSIVKTGAGVQRLGSNNTYSGATTVTGGILQVGAAGTAAARDNGDTGNNVAGNILTVNTAGTVAGTGNIAGTSAVTHLISTGGAIAAGDVVNAAAIDPTGIGTLGVTGGLNASGGTIRLQISGRTSSSPSLPLYFDSGYSAAATALAASTESAATGTARGNHDLLVVSNQITVSNTSTVAITWYDLATSGYTPAAGDSFDLMDWTGVSLSSSFNVGGNFRSGGTGGGSLDLPELTGPLFWDVSQFLSNGVLIIATPEPSRALLMMTGLGMVALRRRRK